MMDNLNKIHYYSNPIEAIKRMEQLEEENKELVLEICSLKASPTLEEHLNNCHNEIIRLKEKNEELKERLICSSENNTKFISKIILLKDEIEGLRKRHVSHLNLIEENKKLKEEIKNMQEYIDIQGNTNGHLTSIVLRQDCELEKLKEELRKYIILYSNEKGLIEIKEVNR